MNGIDLPTLSVVVFSALIDSVNPCAIGVLILMMTVLLGKKRNVMQLLKYGMTYIFAIFLTYLVAGLGLVYFLSTVPITVAEYISLGVGLLVIIAGLLEIKDYYWYGRGFSLHIPGPFARKISQMSKGKLSLWGVTALGAFVAAVELPCTGAPYLAIITILSINFNFQAFLLMVLYNVLFVAPLIIILLLVAAGAKIGSVKKFKEENKGVMRLFIGLLLIALGWMLILMANGTINFG